MIEICPVIIIPKDQVEAIHKTVLHDYYFLWDQQVGNACIALGLGTIYNHSEQPNAEMISNLDDQTMSVKCIRKIEPMEEILINYLDNNEKFNKVWFEVV